MLGLSERPFHKSSVDLVCRIVSCGNQSAHTGFVSSVFLDGGARGPPLLQLRRRNETCRLADGRVPVPRLPPVVIVLTDHLQNVADAKRDSRLYARDQVVLARVVVEQRSYEYLNKKGKEDSKS